MTAESQSDATTPTQSDKNESLSALIGNIQSGITLIIAVGAFVTATGLAIINVYLSKFTDIHGFSVNSTQYLPAGISLLSILVVTIVISALILSGWNYIGQAFSSKLPVLSLKRGWFIIKALGVFLVYLVLGALIYSKIPTFISLLVVTGIYAALVVYGKPPIRAGFQKPFSGSGIYVFGSLLLYAIIGGSVYANSVYGNIPRYLGGGQPATAILVFKDEATLNQLGFSPDPIQATHTQNILLLADLTDGIMVLDPITGRVVGVKNESLLGTIDDKINTDYVVTATPIMTASPSAGPSPTP